MKKILAIITSIGIFITGFVRAETPKPLVLVLLGPPGAGKGTYAVSLSKTLKLPHISTGDLFRDNLNKNTPLGKKAKSYMEKGELVPDDLVIDMLFDRIANKDCMKGYILDGFPRTIYQAESYDKRLNNKAKIIVIDLDIEDAPLIKRITGRIVCKECGSPFHKEFSPPKEPNKCDNCSGELYQRKDDTEKVVNERLKVYHKQTQPIIDFYKNKGNIIYKINAKGNKDVIFQNIMKSINKSN